MFEGIVLKNSKCKTYSDSIVSSEGSTLCGYPLTVNLCLDRILEEIMNGIGSLLGNHVHMCLEDDSSSVLITRCSRFAEYDIAGFISAHIYIVLFSPVKKELLSFLFML